MTAEHDPLLGTEVGGFTLVRCISADVYEARRGDTRAAARIFAHAGAMPRPAIAHPCVTFALASAPRDDGRFVLVHDWIDGSSLEARLEDGPLTWSAATSIVRDLVRGLGAIHTAGLVHGELTPAHILLPASGNPSAVIVDVGHTPAAAAHYRAPEYPAIDHRADLYALGVVIYRMLTGALPADQAPPALCERASAPVPQAVEDLCVWLLAKDPARRMPNAHVLRLTLESLDASAAPAPMATEVTA